MSIAHTAALKTNPHAINWSPVIGIFFFLVALIFVYRSFYAMRIPEEDTGTEDHGSILPHDVRPSQFGEVHAGGGRVVTK
jgi:hypothetical protein